MPSLVEPLPDGTRLRHIGPQKTGSTVLQFALSQVREQLPRSASATRGRVPGPPRRSPTAWVIERDRRLAAQAAGESVAAPDEGEEQPDPSD